MQADAWPVCGATAHSAQLNCCKPADVDAALNAVAQVGDDTLQKIGTRLRCARFVTHGTPANVHAGSKPVPLVWRYQ